MNGQTLSGVIFGFLLLGAPACDDAPSQTAGPGGGAGGSHGTAGASTGGTSAQSCATFDPTLADVDAQALFDYAHVPAFDFYLPAQAWAALQQNAAEEQWAEVDGCFEGRGLGRVALRFKGSYGSLFACAGALGSNACRKLSMKVKFNEYATDQRFYGLKRLNFNANRFDDSRIKERLAYDLFRSMGITAPRAAWAVVRVNGESQGLFGMVEEVDGRFTSDRWPDNGDGNLIKEAWPTVDTSEADVISRLSTNEDNPDVSAFLAFGEAMNAASENELRSTLAAYMQLEQFEKFLAVEDALASYDGITYFWTDGSSSRNHNFYLYQQAADNFTLVPWDVESTFWINPNHAAPHWTVAQQDCSLTYPYWEGLAKAPACDPMIRAVGSDLSGWRAAAQALLDGPFTEAAMNGAINRWAEFIKKEAEADPTPPSYGPFASAVAGVRSSVPALRARLQQLMVAPSR